MSDFQVILDAASLFVDRREGDVQDLGLELGELRHLATELLQRELYRWQSVEIAHLHALVAMTSHLNYLASSSWRTNRKLGNTLDVVLELHMQAGLVASEILCLVEGGHVQAAEARWRTLYEVSVVGRFVAHAPDRVARMYKASFVAEQRRRLRAMSPDPTDHKSVDDHRQATARVEKRMKQLREMYGPQVTQPYGWASEAPDSGRTTFRDVVERVTGLDDTLWLRYAFASQHVHGVRMSSIRTLSRRSEANGPVFAPKPASSVAVLLETAAVLQSITHAVSRCLWSTNGDARVVFLAEVCSMIALDVQTEALRGRVEIDRSYLDLYAGISDASLRPFDR